VSDAASRPSKTTGLLVEMKAGPELLCRTEAFFQRFLVLPPLGALVLALYSFATHCFQLFDQFAYLVLLSPVKGCGKTRVTETLEGPAANVLLTAGISEAALFRLIETRSPTLVLDEAEALSGKSERAEAIRSLLNAGNRADTLVYRCQGPNHELRGFRVYGPKIICAIRVCPETVKDRAIVLWMQKKLPTQPVERFIRSRVKPEGEALRKEIAGLVKTAHQEIASAYQGLDLAFLPDRDAENWMPLFALATVLAPERLADLHAVAERLTGQKVAEDQDDSLSLRLLGDIQEVWSEDEPTIFTDELLRRLSGVEDAPWGREVPLDPRKLARMLRPFGLSSQQVRMLGSEKTSKGYRREAFQVAARPYLAAPGKQAKQPATGAVETPISHGKHEQDVSHDKCQETPLFTRVVSLVSDDGPGRGRTRNSPTDENPSQECREELLL